MKIPYLKYYFTKSILLLFVLLLNASVSSGQQVETISINMDKLEKKPLLLSEITGNITSITLDSLISGNLVDIFLTSKYLFVTTMSSVYQFKPSGKFVSKFNCGGSISHSTCDTTKQEIYVLMKNKIKSFDFSGKLKKEYSIKHDGINCFFHGGKLWIQSANVSFKTPAVDYKLSYLNLQTGVETFLPLNIQKKIEKDEEAITIYPATFFIDNQTNNNLICSFSIDNTLYRIQGQNVKPVIRWTHPVVSKYKSTRKYIFKDYLFVHFSAQGDPLLYVQNMKTQKQYLTEFLRDDIFGSGNIHIGSFNQGGCFYFIRKENELKGKYSNNSRSENRNVIIIADLK